MKILLTVDTRLHPESGKIERELRQGRREEADSILRDQPGHTTIKKFNNKIICRILRAGLYPISRLQIFTKKLRYVKICMDFVSDLQFPHIEACTSIFLLASILKHIFMKK